MSDEFTKAVCEAVQELYLGHTEGDYTSYIFCESCGADSPENSCNYRDIVHTNNCIVPKVLEYLKPELVEERTYCGFSIAWVGTCGMALPCHEHDNQLCSTKGCSNIATYSCEHTSFGVCGAPHCASHGCNHGR